jgi:hypothetical protein
MRAGMPGIASVGARQRRREHEIDPSYVAGPDDRAPSADRRRRAAGPIFESDPVALRDEIVEAIAAGGVGDDRPLAALRAAQRERTNCAGALPAEAGGADRATASPTVIVTSSARLCTPSLAAKWTGWHPPDRRRARSGRCASARRTPRRGAGS